MPRHDLLKQQSPCPLKEEMMAAVPVSKLLPQTPGISGGVANGRDFELGCLRLRSSSLEHAGRVVSSKSCRAQNVNVVRASASSEFNATSSSDYLPKAEFYKVEAILRPWRLAHVTSALLNAGIRGVTVTDVRGLGAQGGALERHAGSEFSEDSFVSKVKLEIVVSADQVELVIESIIDEARTGEIGDGKIFVIPIADVIRVRTGERGLKAERMIGGRADKLSAAR